MERQAIAQRPCAAGGGIRATRVAIISSFIILPSSFSYHPFRPFGSHRSLVGRMEVNHQEDQDEGDGGNPPNHSYAGWFRG